MKFSYMWQTRNSIFSKPELNVPLNCKELDFGEIKFRVGNQLFKKLSSKMRLYN